MQNITFQETENTPFVSFDFTKGIFEVRGVSFPEYARDFYEPILESLREYAQKPPVSKTTMSFKFIYFNTGTNSFITGIVKELEFLHKQGHAIDLFWYYELDDEDMRELGGYFQSLTFLPVEFVACERL